MALKNFNPVTPSLRGTILVDRSELWKGKPVKGLTVGKSSTGGRNNHGHITSRFRGGGHKRTLPRRSTSSGASSTCRRRSSGWNTTRTAPRSSR